MRHVTNPEPLKVKQNDFEPGAKRMSRSWCLIFNFHSHPQSLTTVLTGPCSLLESGPNIWFLDLLGKTERRAEGTNLMCCFLPVHSWHSSLPFSFLTVIFSLSLSLYLPFSRFQTKAKGLQPAKSHRFSLAEPQKAWRRPLSAFSFPMYAPLSLSVCSSVHHSCSSLCRAFSILG